MVWSLHFRWSKAIKVHAVNKEAQKLAVRDRSGLRRAIGGGHQ